MINIIKELLEIRDKNSNDISWVNDGNHISTFLYNYNIAKTFSSEVAEYLVKLHNNLPLLLKELMKLKTLEQEFLRLKELEKVVLHFVENNTELYPGCTCDSCKEYIKIKNLVSNSSKS